MHAFAIGLLAVGTLGLLYEASRIFWQEMRTLRYLNEPWGDEWTDVR